MRQGTFRVESRNIQAITYIAHSSSLVVLFNNNRAYIYKDVPVIVFIEAQTAVAIGSFFNRNVKGYYSFESISEDRYIELTKNLCELCTYDLGNCEGNPQFGDGIGKDNVYMCDKYTRK